MTLVRFFTWDGRLDREVEASPGANLLDLAQANGQLLEGACEGQMACSTCHVLIDKDDFERIPPANEEEDDLLDLAWGVTRFSRLACQVAVPEGGPFTVRMPGGSYNLDR